MTSKFIIPRIGETPPGFNEKVHGAYDPARYYGKPDTPFGEVRISELTAWMKRRNMGLRPLAGLGSRAFWRWQQKYVLPKYSTFAPVLQVVISLGVFSYIINIGKIREHKMVKYHW